MVMGNYDFTGWATKNDLKCADGRTIRKDAFKDCDGKKVPLVWNHNHSGPEYVLGHALLKNCPEGVRCFCKLNDTSIADTARKCLTNGDIDALSIWANNLTQTKTRDVLHGDIKEVSLVLAGANPGAIIDDIVAHGDDGEEAFIYSGEDLEMFHADEGKDSDMAENTEKSTSKKNDSSDKTIAEIFEGFTDEQRTAVNYVVGKVVEQFEGKSDKGDDDMKHNVFENETNSETTLKHSMSEINDAISDARRYGSMRDAFLAHGIDNVEWLYPDDKTLDVPPRIIDKDQTWVNKVMGGVHHIPFSRFKSMFADLTEEDARAKGYIKGNFKKEQVFGLLKRSTAPTTVYKKQKMDRDDIIDINWDIMAWLKKEMRVKLDEEIARAILISDGRLASSDDKINEQCIRPIYNDDDLFTIKCQVEVKSADDANVRAKAVIRSVIKARKDYKGSGNPDFYTTEDILTDMLLLEDDIGRPLYVDEAALARKLRVRSIVTVPHMEGMTGAKGGEFVGLIVNLADYTVGADKGGAVNMFDDFDIDYNQQKYLIETRCSGALTTPFSAIAVEYKVAG